MPLYEYQCQQCHRRVEKIQKFSDAPLAICAQCGGALERTLTAPAVQFKGSGWYKDLYSSAKPAAATGNGEGVAPATASGGEGGSASGSEAKPTAPTSPAGANAGTAAPAAAPTSRTEH